MIRIGYAPGAYDLFHIGHLTPRFGHRFYLLTNAASGGCQPLIVGTCICCLSF